MLEYVELLKLIEYVGIIRTCWNKLELLGWNWLELLKLVGYVGIVGICWNC
jgi:hypothetical protein